LHSTDIRVVGTKIYFLPVETRVPLKFGPETLTNVTCVRVCMTVADENGRQATGWGETPLSVQWAWPSDCTYEMRQAAMRDFCCVLAKTWVESGLGGHPLEIGHAFWQSILPAELTRFNARRQVGKESMPWLAALVCLSAFDIALHDAYGMLHDLPVYQTYNEEFMNTDLSYFLSSAERASISFIGKYPDEFLNLEPPKSLVAWHLVGGEDAIHPSDFNGTEIDDGYPFLLSDWIKRDGLKCLKVKLRGNDPVWDYERIVTVGKIAMEHGVLWLTADFNCTVNDPLYVTDILDRLLIEHPDFYAMILYVEQPFPYDLEKHRIDVHSVSARKPIFLDESAHDWHSIELGRQLGWTGVALKTCKTQTGAILSLCWAKAHGMTLMVQDLTNPMLAQIPHVLLAAHADTIMGVETNSMQFYPEASSREAVVHPGIYQRSNGRIDLSSISGSGFGYRLREIDRKLPPVAASFEA
jgi:L-alanine-DL-glutamate epimerase-like enolase superfamily enzyme